MGSLREGKTLLFFIKAERSDFHKYTIYNIQLLTSAAKPLEAATVEYTKRAAVANPSPPQKLYSAETPIF